MASTKPGQTNVQMVRTCVVAAVIFAAIGALFSETIFENLPSLNARTVGKSTAVAPHHQDDFSESASNENGVLVELFTSQGCNSCPPADRLLAEIKRESKQNQQSTFVLSYHVDYWNDLGWPDPFSQEKFSRRQRLYARAFESERIYTPQMVVNGLDSFVGSNKELAEDSIARSHQQDRTLRLHLKLQVRPTDSTAMLISRVETAKDLDWDQYQLVVALVHTPPTTEVQRGENANQKLSHVNVVRSLQFDTLQGPENTMKFSILEAFHSGKKKSIDWSVVAFVQELDSMEVIAVNQVFPAKE